MRTNGSEKLALNFARALCGDGEDEASGLIAQSETWLKCSGDLLIVGFGENGKV